MTFAESIKSGFKNYFVFSGVASRSAYWYFVLFTALVGIVASTADSVMQGSATGANAGTLGTLASLVFLIPRLSLAARRFHDAGISALWLLLQLAPLVALLFAIPAILKTVGAFTPDVIAAIAAQDTSVLQNLMPIIGELLLALLPAILLSVGYAIFELVVLLKRTKTAAQGNKYAPVAPNTVASDN